MIITFYSTGSLFVMAAGLTVEWEPVAARLADPALSATAAVVLCMLNYSFSKLLPTIKLTIVDRI